MWLFTIVFYYPKNWVQLRDISTEWTNRIVYLYSGISFCCKMVFQVIKRHERNLKHIQMEEVNLKRMHSPWFQLFDNLESQNYTNSKISVVSRDWRGQGKGFENVKLMYLCDTLIVTLMHVLKPQNFTKAQTSENQYRMGARDVTRESKWMQMLEMSLLWGQEECRPDHFIMRGFCKIKSMRRCRHCS